MFVTLKIAEHKKNLLAGMAYIIAQIGGCIGYRSKTLPESKPFIKSLEEFDTLFEGYTCLTVIGMCIKSSPLRGRACPARAGGWTGAKEYYLIVWLSIYQYKKFTLRFETASFCVNYFIWLRLVFSYLSFLHKNEACF